MRDLKLWFVGIPIACAVLGAVLWYSASVRFLVATRWGDLASVVGLFLSLLAAIFSSRASKAAEKARRAILARTLEDEINGGYRLASDITTLVGISQFSMALTKCGDLLDVPNRIRIRWEQELTTESKNNWLVARQQLDSIHTVLAKIAAGSAPTPREVVQLSKGCLSVRTIFVEEQSVVTKQADKR